MTAVNSTATFTPAAVNLGGTVTINSSFTSSVAATNVSLDVEVRDASNNKVFQQLFSGQAFNAGEPRVFTSVWVTPGSPQAAGTYTVKLGAFTGDWLASYGWNDHAASISVGASPSTRPLLTSTATVTPSKIKPGASATITATLTSATVAPNVNIDVEVRDATNKLMFQRLFVGQSFAAGQRQNYVATWNLPATLTPGAYRVKIGAFSSDWTNGLGWNDDAAPIDVQGAAGGGSDGIRGTPYFVDCAAGNDAAAGTSQAEAWSSMGRANQAQLQPGDGLLFKRGCSWTGPLNATWSGTASLPITIGAYGSGALPKLQNANPYQVRVTGRYLTFDSLWVRSDPDFVDPSCNNNRIGYREGFYFEPGSEYNVVQNSYLSDLGGGLEIAAASHNNSVHDNEFANNNMMYDTDQFRNDGGSAAVVIYGDSNDIGFNSIHDSNACSRRYVNNITGHAFDIETGANNSFHHNRAWANGANFAELVNSNNSTFAYNIVGNAFTNHTNSRGTRLYNNVFYMPGAGILTCQSCTPASMSVKNNIFYGATGIYADGPLSESNNIFWNGGNFVYNTQALAGGSRVADPMFVNGPGGDFHIQPGSPAIRAGASDSLNAGYNIDMDRKPVTGSVDIGAYQR